MKCFRHFLAVAVLIGSASPALAQTADEVRAAIERHYTAIHAADLDTVFDEHLPEMTWFAVQGQLLFESGAAEAAERMGATPEYGSGNVYMNHFSAQMYGNVAVATFYLVDTALMDGKAIQRTSRVTAVWVKEAGEWKEAHHHESPLMGSGGD